MPNTSQNKLPQLNNNCGNPSSHETAFIFNYSLTEALTPTGALSILMLVGEHLKISGLTLQELRNNTAYAIFHMYELAKVNSKTLDEKISNAILPYKIFYSFITQIESKKLLSGKNIKLSKVTANEAFDAIAYNQPSNGYSLISEDITEIKAFAIDANFTYLKLMEKEGLILEYLEPMNLFTKILMKIEEIIVAKNESSASLIIQKFIKEKNKYWLQDNILFTKN